jgi:nucleotide-binding universal stress UspA family protein
MRKENITMSGIVCAIRGGPDSQPTIDQSITLAKETKQIVYFLYVVNLDFLSHTATSRVQVVAKEMRQMGEFILLTAQAQAIEMGIEAETVVRQGQVGEEIIELCRTIEADYVVLGRPSGQEEADIFTLDRLKQFAQHIEQESHAKVVLTKGHPQ